MAFLTKFKTDKNAEEDGVWVQLDDEASIKVARLNNKKAKELRRTLEKPYRNFTTIPDSVNEDILIKVVAQAVVKDWKGFTDDTGDVPFASATAEKLFKEYPDLLNEVVSVALARETFQTEGMEASKNG